MFVRPDIGRSRITPGRAGFTIAETMVSTLILVILVGACFLLFITGTQSWQTNRLQIERQQELRRAADWITDDLRQSGNATITNVPSDGAWRTTITFKTASGVSGGVITWSANTIQYVLGGTNGNQLQRITGSDTKVVGQYISSVQFRRQSTTPNIVEVQITARNATLFNRWQQIQDTISFKVKLRN